MKHLADILLAYPSFIFEILAFLSALFNFFRKKDQFLLWFTVLLLLTLLVDLGSPFGLIYVISIDGKNSNNWAFNFFNPIEFCFYSLFYYFAINNLVYRKRMQYLSMIYFLAVPVNLLFGQKLQNLNSYTYILGSLILITFVFAFFRDLVQREEFEKMTIFKQRIFWISTGVLVFYGCDAVIMAFFQYFLFINRFPDFINFWIISSSILNSILYSCLAISFFLKPLPRAT